ncbi:MAG: hypothetical protein ABWY12_12185 [Burkholderiales bacterium]
MTAQGIEAATADKTRRGLAEGESPVRQDAPNPLYQEGYSMTDTTDQQAVTVAQDRVQFCINAIAKLQPHKARFEMEKWLASVSSASAEGIKACIELCERMEADKSLPDEAGNAAWNLKVGMRHLLKQASANSEPVPATNQAGEVEWKEGSPFNVAEHGRFVIRDDVAPTVHSRRNEETRRWETPVGGRAPAISSQAVKLQEGQETHLRREVAAVINEMSRQMPNTTEDWRARLTEAMA